MQFKNLEKKIQRTVHLCLFWSSEFTLTMHIISFRFCFDLVWQVIWISLSIRFSDSLFYLWAPAQEEMVQLMYSFTLRVNIIGLLWILPELTSTLDELSKLSFWSVKVRTLVALLSPEGTVSLEALFSHGQQPRRASCSFCFKWCNWAILAASESLGNRWPLHVHYCSIHKRHKTPPVMILVPMAGFIPKYILPRFNN